MLHQKIKYLARPYSPFICGTPIKSKYNKSDNSYILIFITNENCKTNITQLYLDENYYFKNGIKYEITNCESCTFTKIEKGYYSLNHENI